MNYLTDPFTLVVIGIVVIVAALLFMNRTRIAAAGKALMTKPIAAEAAAKPYVSRFISTAELDAEKAAGIVRSWLHHPAAPAASVAATPPAAVPEAPSAGSGGTAPVQVVVTASDAVLAKHAQLDAVIADHQTAIATHQAAIVDVQNQKAAVTAAQDALNKLVA